jgi:integrase
VVDVAAKGCPRQQKKKGGFVTRSEAVAAMNRLQLELADGTYVGLTYLTTGEYLAAWCEAVAVDGLIRPTTAKTYNVAVRVHIAPVLGSVPLQQLTRNAIRGLYETLRESGRARGEPGGLAPKAVYNVHLTLHRALEDAVADGLLRYNPAARAHRPTASKIEMRVWSSAQLRQFLASVERDAMFPLWRLAATTGMRRGELLGLGWSDVDLDGARLTVRRQLIRIGRRTGFGRPKTEAGRRCISLDPTTVEVLRQHKQRHAVTWREDESSYPSELDLVFCRPDGNGRDPDVVSHQFTHLVRQAGLPKIRLHDLRHTHATLALQAGVHPKVVQERLGHASVKVTLDTYSHVMPPMHQEAAARVAAIVDGP